MYVTESARGRGVGAALLRRERYGHIGGVWHDVVLLERRSDRAGGPGLPTRTCG